MRVTINFVREVCKIGQRDDTCRYLACGEEGWLCLKLMPEAEQVERMVLYGYQPALGDNCEGRFFE